MTRLEAELQRLYLFPAPADSAPPHLLDAGDRVKAMLLEVSGPAAWEVLSPVWQGVQADLELPAPAIAVNGADGFQLWFSLAEPVTVAQAQAFLAGLRTRHLGAAVRQRIRTFPADPSDLPPLPPLERSPGRWSAFVAPDLAPLFSDDPSLDLPPGSEAQAELLSRVANMRNEDFQRALERLAPAAASPAAAPDFAGRGSPSATLATTEDPRRFLLDVMNDPAVALPLRIEAAKALLPCADLPRRTP
jgi:hypothetical protein